MKTRLLAITFVLLLLVSPFTHIAYAEEEDPNGGDGVEEPEETPVDPAVLEMLLTQAGNVRLNLESIYGENLEDMPPAVWQNYQSAIQAMEQAEEFEERNPTAAAQQALRAMKQLRNALRKIGEESPDTLEALSTEPEVDGDDPPEGEDDPDLENQINEYKQQLIESFEERFRDRLTAMEEFAAEISDQMLPEDAAKLQSTLSKTEEKLLHIQQKILDGKFDEAIDDLDETSEDMDDELGDMVDDGTAQMLRTINKLEAKIQKTIERKERKAAAGEDTSEEDEALGLLHGKKIKVKEDHGKPDNNGNGNDKPNGKPDKEKPDNPNKDKTD
ncbi:MAG: hypothetical protein NWE89_09115 [Candidatus Bathyarchaeota archaeon]|nr:hypothetical protein [Candidatus Bathyarchaeota archaeon]